MSSIAQNIEMSEYNACIFALQDSFEWLYDVNLKSGEYTQYIKGETFSESVNTQLVENGDFFADAQENVKIVVHPEDRKGFCRVINRDFIRRSLEKESHFDWYYRLVLNERTSWFKMRIVYKDGTREHVIIGIFNADKEIAAKLRAEQDRKDLISKIGGSESTYIINPLTEEFIPLNRNAYLEGTYSADDSYTQSITKYVATDVFAPDRKATAEALRLDNLIRQVDLHHEFVFRFRDTSSGMPHWYELRAARLSETEILLGFSNKDKKIIGSMIFEKMRESYFGLYYVNLESGLAQIIKTAHPELTGEAGSAVPYGSLIKSISAGAEGETVAFLNKIGDVNFLKAHFATEDLSYSAYKSVAFEGKKWVNLTGLVLARKESGEPSVIALGFSLLDEAAAEKEEAKIKLEESMDVVGGLASEYTAIYHVNLDTDDYVPYHLIQKTEDIRALYDKCPKFVDLAHGFAHSPLVRPEDRANLKAFYPSAEAVKEALKDKKRISMIFKRNYGGEFLWTEISIVKCEAESEEAHKVIVAFMEKDQEIKERAKHFVEAEEANLLIENIASKYNLAYGIDMEDDTFKVLRIDDQIIGQDRTFNVFSDVKEFFLSEVVHPSDKERMGRELDYSNIRERLAKEKSYVVDYKALVDGATIWNEMIVTQVKGDNIAIGFALKDMEITKRLLEDKRIEEYIALFAVDIDTEMIKPLKTPPLFKTSEIGKAVPYEAAMKSFAADCEGDAKTLITKLSSIDFFKKELVHEDKRTYLYKSDKLKENTWVEIVIYVIDRHDDGTPAMFALGYNLADSSTAERQELQRKIRETQKQLEEALSMAQSANRAKTTFLNNMSHDIRTPMNAIIGYTGLATSHIDNKEQVKDYLGKIGESSEHLLSLINDVLDMSRIESGKTHLEEKEENLSDIVHSLKDIVSANVQAKNLDFKVEASGIKDENIVCDKLRLNQVLLNILSNSIKYTPAGGSITFTVSEIESKKNGYSEFKFTVKDTGIGMSKDFLKTIFDPFTRVESATVSKIQGTGLGMAITKNIIDMMGGKIEIDSELGAGTTTDIFLSFKTVETAERTLSLPKLSKARTLIVDDSPESCMSMAKMLKNMGIRSLWCTTGKEAIIRAEDGVSNEDEFKVFFINQTLPDISCEDTIAKIRGISGQEVPIYVMTQSDRSEAEKAAGMAAVSGYVGKPIFPSDLQAVLEGCLGEKASPAKPAEAFSLAGKKILLVEDNELNCEIATAILEEYGCAVTCAEDGAVAVEKMKRFSPGDYDLILMDIQMPRMNGYEATGKIREMLEPQGIHIPIIALSANAFEEDKQKSRDAGMDDHIAKPIDIAQLTATLAKFL